jgi:hypothetical protein
MDFRNYNQLSSMFEKIQKFKLSTPVRNIHRIWSTFNNSILILDAALQQSAFLHFDCNGRESYRFTIDYQSVNFICLIDDRSLAIYEDKLHRITLINFFKK